MKQGHRTIHLEIGDVVEQLGLTSPEMIQFLSEMNEKYGEEEVIQNVAGVRKRGLPEAG